MKDYINKFREIYHSVSDRRLNASYQVCSFGTVVWFEFVDISNYDQEIREANEDVQKFWRRKYEGNRFAISGTDWTIERAREDANEELYKAVLDRRSAMKEGDAVYLQHPNRNAHYFIKGRIKEFSKPGFIVVEFENVCESLLEFGVYSSLEDLIWDKKRNNEDKKRKTDEIIDRAASNILSEFYI